MKLNLNSIFTMRFWGCVVSTLLLAAITSCGGGNGPGGKPLGPDGPGVNGTVRLTLTDPAGFIDNIIPPNPYLNVIANVTDAAGHPVTNVTVKFAVDDTTVGFINPLKDTALTDAAGNAIVTLLPGLSLGAATITATATIGANTNTGQIGFEN